jgi:two-component system response regulator DesR
VILLTTFARSGYLQRAVKAGAHGYLLKDSQVEDLAAAIRNIVGGQRIFSPALMVEAMTEENPLTPREIDVLRCARTGVGTREIAKRLALSEGTVRNYLSEAISKLGCASRQEAVQRAEQKGWL